MANLIETFDLSQILQPVQRPEIAKQDIVIPAASLTVKFGTFFGIKTADLLAYPLNSGASDGTQNAKGIFMYSFLTDTNGKVFYAPSAVASARTGAWTGTPVWIKGIFNPSQLLTNAGAGAAEVDTFTAASVTAGDVYTVSHKNPDLSTVVISYTAVAGDTATTVANAFRSLWNASPNLAPIATASGTATFILTGTSTGQALSLTATAVGTGTWTKATTTAAAGLTFSDLAAGIPSARILHNGFWSIE